MITEREITAAIGAHSVWKSRLRKAIDSGRFDMPAETIEADDRCDFGQWLIVIAPEVTEEFERQYWLVKRRHTHFHEVAARVAVLIAAGRSAEAEEMLAFHGELSVSSAMLTEAMIEWKSVLASAP